jgi:hypothetical protein
MDYAKGKLTEPAEGFPTSIFMDWLSVTESEKGRSVGCAVANMGVLG